MDLNTRLLSTDYLFSAKPSQSIRLPVLECSEVEVSTLRSNAASLQDVTVVGSFNVNKGVNGILNVKDYGAIGSDGSIDDTISIQKAIDEAKLKGVKVYFPAGIYKVTSQINLSNNSLSFGLFGDGRSSILKIATESSGFNVLGGSNINDLSIEDLMIDCNHRLGSGGIYISDSSIITISRLYVYDFLTSGVVINGSLASEIENHRIFWIKNCDIDGNGVGINGISLNNVIHCNIEACQLRNMTISDVSSSNLQIRNKTQRCVINDCIMDSGRVGIVCDNNISPLDTGVQDCSVGNCIIRNCNQAVVLDKAVNNSFSNLKIDMQEKDGSLEAISLLDGTSLSLSSKNNVFRRINISGILQSKFLVYIGVYGNNNYISIDNLSDSAHMNMISFASNSQANIGKLNSQIGVGDITDLSLYHTDAGINNEFVFKGNTNKTLGAGALQTPFIENTSTSNLDTLNCIQYFRTAATGFPDFVLMALASTGSIGGLYGYKFPSTSQRDVFFVGVQLPNSWREGSRIFPHCHFLLSEIPTSVKDMAQITLEYSITNLQSSVSTTTISVPLTVSLNSLGISNEGYHLDLNLIPAGIDMTGKTQKCVMMFKVSRIVLGGSYYTGDMYLTSFAIDFNKRYVSGQ